MSGPGATPRVLATQHWDRPQTEAGSHYGAWVAAEAFFAAMVRYGSWDRYDFFAVPTRRASVARRLADLRPDKARVREFSDLRTEGPELGISAWHGIALEASMIPFELRRRYPNEVFPVTLAAFQALSYQEMLHGVFLPLLLADTLACDSIICSSAAARRSVAILLESVSNRFNHRHGTDLRFRGRIDTIPLGVDTEALQPSDRPSARRALMLPAEPLILLWLGRISSLDKADLLPLLTAFADVRQYMRVLGGEDARPLMLVLAGGDPHGHAGLLERQARELGVADAVRIHTRVDAFNKGLYYAAADIFVAPTDNIQESFGITPVEAMACGLPQLVADWDGYRDTVVHDETGLLVPTLWADCDGDLLEDPQTWQDRTDHAVLAQSVALDPTQLRSSLLSLVNNEDLRRRMGEASRRRAEERFAWPRVIEQHEQLWDQLRTEAEGLRAARSQSLPHDRPLFFEAFRHYATTILDDDQRIQRSVAGAAALERHGELAPAFGEMDPRLLRLALEQIGEDGCTIGDLLSRLESVAERSYPESLLRRHVMRLLKYGYAQLP